MQMTDVWVNGPFYSIKRLNTENIEYLRIWFLCGMTLKVLFASLPPNIISGYRDIMFSAVSEITTKIVAKFTIFLDKSQQTFAIQLWFAVCFSFISFTFFLSWISIWPFVCKIYKICNFFMEKFLNRFQVFSPKSSDSYVDMPNAIRSKIGFLLIKVFVKY